MVLSKEDKAIIELLFKEKGWKGRRIAKEFPSKKWTQSTIDRLITKIQTTGTTDRKRGSGRPTTVSTPENVAQIEELAASPKGYARYAFVSAQDIPTLEHQESICQAHPQQ